VALGVINRAMHELHGLFGDAQPADKKNSANPEENTSSTKYFIDAATAYSNPFGKILYLVADLFVSLLGRVSSHKQRAEIKTKEAVDMVYNVAINLPEQLPAKGETVGLYSAYGYSLRLDDNAVLAVTQSPSVEEHYPQDASQINYYASLSRHPEDYVADKAEVTISSHQIGVANYSLARLKFLINALSLVDDVERRAIIFSKMLVILKCLTKAYSVVDDVNKRAIIFSNIAQIYCNADAGSEVSKVAIAAIRSIELKSFLEDLGNAIDNNLLLPEHRLKIANMYFLDLLENNPEIAFNYAKDSFNPKKLKAAMSEEYYKKLLTILYKIQQAKIGNVLEDSNIRELTIESLERSLLANVQSITYREFRYSLSLQQKTVISSNNDTPLLTQSVGDLDVPHYANPKFGHNTMAALANNSGRDPDFLMELLIYYLQQHPKVADFFNNVYEFIDKDYNFTEKILNKLPKLEEKEGHYNAFNSLVTFAFAAKLVVNQRSSTNESKTNN